MPQQRKAYLHPSIFQWSCSADSYTISTDPKIRRSYDTLNHASSLIDGEINEFKLSDAVMNLKRAVNVRLKLLDELYEFSHVGLLKKLGALERLEAVGLARPFLIRQLFELRNDIEHNDASPPIANRIKELIDIVWYFLKTTDSAVAAHSRMLVFRAPGGNDEADEPWLEIGSFRGKSKRIEIRGSYVSPIISPTEGWEIKIERIIEKPVVNYGSNLNGNFNISSDLLAQARFIGTVEGESKLLINLWGRMFSLSEA